MTEPPEEIQPESPNRGLGDRSLRDQLLRDMSGGECLSLSHIDSYVSYNHSAESLDSRQSRIFVAIESLLNDGLLVVGDIVGASDEHVDPWKLSTKEALDRLRELYVSHYGDRDRWGWVVWFALTPEGERVAEEMGTKGDPS